MCQTIMMLKFAKKIFLSQIKRIILRALNNSANALLVCVDLYFSAAQFSNELFETERQDLLWNGLESSAVKISPHDIFISFSTSKERNMFCLLCLQELFLVPLLFIRRHWSEIFFDNQTYSRAIFQGTRLKSLGLWTFFSISQKLA